MQILLNLPIRKWLCDHQTALNVFLVLCAASIVVLSIPAVWPVAGIWALAALFLVTVSVAPIQALALEVFLLPVREFGTITSLEMHSFHSLAMLALSARFFCSIQLKSIPRLIRATSVRLLFCFGCLVALDNIAGFATREYWKSLAYAVSLLLILQGVYASQLSTERITRLITFAIIAAATFSVGFDAAYLYLPMPDLLPVDPALPPDKLRFAGLHANPVATSKFILIAVCYFLCRSVRRGLPLQKLISTIAGFIFFSAALISTETKASLLALGLSIIVFGCGLVSVKRPLPRLVRLTGVSVVLVAMFLGWALAAGPMIKRYSANGWLAHIDHRSDIKELSSSLAHFRPIRVAAASNDVILVGIAIRSESANQQSSWADRIIERIERAFRIGQSYRLKGSSGDLKDDFDATVHNVSGEKRNCGILCTGQRDLLWHSGVKIIREHWLVGIGFGGWKPALQRELGYPFDSPHVGLLDSWGEFGLAGAAIYLWLVGVLIIRLLRSAKCGSHDSVGAESIWLSLSALALLLTEIANASNYFAVSALSLWGWLLIGLQDRLVMIKRA